MSYFEEIIFDVLDHEGGARFVDHPNDPGGATKYGISLRWLQSVWPHANEHNIRRLTERQAITLYRMHFWLPEYDELSDREIAARVFDHHVNAGARSAAKVLQRAIVATGSRIKIDGIIGPKTVAAANAAGPALLWCVRSERAGFYRSLAAGKAQFKVFLLGWLRRAYW